jgi:hypothetical protein
MDGLARWIIEKGPVELQAGEVVEFDISIELVQGAGFLCQHELCIPLYAVQTLEGTTKFVFQSGRLFGSGEIMTLWGVYDTATRQGELWLLTVPRQYIGFFRA